MAFSSNLEEALAQAKVGRLKILDHMITAIACTAYRAVGIRSENHHDQNQPRQDS